MWTWRVIPTGSTAGPVVMLLEAFVRPVLGSLIASIHVKVETQTQPLHPQVIVVAGGVVQCGGELLAWTEPWVPSPALWGGDGVKENFMFRVTVSLVC